MEHALRSHMRKKFDEDPAHYGRLSDRLKGILQEFEGRWEEMVAALQGLLQETLQGRQKDESTGLDPVTQAPFFDILKIEKVGDSALDSAQFDILCGLTVEIVDHIQQEIAIVGFWEPHRTQAREGLRRWIIQTLDDNDLVTFPRLEAVAEKLMELTKANHHRLVR
jgi:type I restriction enzyme R subunit